MLVPKFKFNNGKEVPAFGLGTSAAATGVVKETIKTAIDLGYRHFDCAYVYGNEAEIGEALAEKIADGSVKREDLFITSKLWNAFHSKEKVAENLAITLKNLKLSYLDLYLMHWPQAYKYKEGPPVVPGNDRSMFSDVDYLETWQGMEEAVKKGLVKSIGVSNFNSQQLERLLGGAKIIPAMQQIEVHPHLTNEKLVKLCQDRGILVTAYCPLGRPNDTRNKDLAPAPLNEEVVLNLVKKYKRTPAQILLRYLYQRGIVIIPKSVNKDRLQQNIDIFDFTLDAEEIEKINKLNKNGRVCSLGDTEHPLYPFHLPY